ncbi:MAG: PAS domain-containing protein [Anaerolineae bacterium]|nr:PAS domain-containing protein [Anaerolineae bacterium]
MSSKFYTEAEDKSTEVELRASQLLHLIMDNIPQAVFWKDRNSIYLWCNRNFAIDAGVAVPENIVGKTDHDLAWTAAEAESFRDVDRRVMDQDSPEYNFIEPQTQADGKFAWLETNKIPLHDAEGHVIGILGTYEDITERKQAEEALRTSQQMLRLVIDNIPQAVFWKDSNSVYLGCNISFAVDAGVGSPDNIVGKTDQDLAWTPEQAGNFFRDDQRVMANDKPEYNFIEPQTQADGKLAWLQTNKIPLHDAEGNVVGILGTYEDITERIQAERALKEARDDLEKRVKARTAELSATNEQLKQEIAERQRAEEALRLSKERYALAVNAGRTGIWEWNTATASLYLDPSLRAIFGMDDVDDGRHQLSDLLAVVHPEDRVAVSRSMSRHLQGLAHHYEQEYRILRANQEVRSVLARGSAFLDKSGIPVRMMGSITDITALKLAEEALQRRDQILEALAYASQHLLLPDSLDEALPGVLGQIGQAVGFSRAYILKNYTTFDGELWAGRHAVWSAENHRPGVDVPYLPDFAYLPSGLGRWVRLLKAGAIISGLCRDFTEQERRFLTAQHILSLSWVPIFSEGEWWGVIGFDDCLQERQVDLGAELDALRNAASALGSAFAQQRIRAAEREQRTLAEALRDTAALLNSTLNLDEVLDRILSEIGRVVPHDMADIILVESGDSHSMRYRSVMGQPSQRQEVNLTFALDELPNLHQMAQTKEPLIIQDVHEAPLWVERPGTCWVRSYLGAPIQSEGKVIGFINLNSATKGFFDLHHAERLRAFANQAAIAIQNARLYEQAQALAALEERQRLARDLHDAVSQTLWTASLIADVLPTLWEEDIDEGQRSLAQLRRLTRGALAEMRTMLLELRPTALVEASLGDLMDHLAKATMSRKKLDIALTVQGQCLLPPDVQVGLYRIAQETLNNTAKHARATHVDMDLYCAPGVVTLSIRDNGRGFNIEKLSPERLGLGIMHERAAMLNADLSITSAVGAGTGVTITWRKPVTTTDDHEEEL